MRVLDILDYIDAEFDEKFIQSSSIAYTYLRRAGQNLVPYRLNNEWISFMYFDWNDTASNWDWSNFKRKISDEHEITMIKNVIRGNKHEMYEEFKMVKMRYLRENKCSATIKNKALRQNPPPIIARGNY